MKQIVAISLVTLLSFCSCGGSGKKQAESTTNTSADTVTSIEFDNKNYNFGQVIKGETVEHTYFFTNTGSIDLVVEEVAPSCGCTIPDWSKDPVKPGEQGKIKVKFETKSQSLGNKSKQVAVYTNTVPSRNLLYFTAQVVAEK